MKLALYFISLKVNEPDLLGLVDLIQDEEEKFVVWDVGHGVAIVLIAQVPFFIENHSSRQATQFQQVNLLLVQVGYVVFGVGQSNIGNIVFLPVTLKGTRAIGTNGQDFGLPGSEFSIVVAQAR